MFRCVHHQLCVHNYLLYTCISMVCLFHTNWQYILPINNLIYMNPLSFIQYQTSCGHNSLQVNLRTIHNRKHKYIYTKHSNTTTIKSMFYTCSAEFEVYQYMLNRRKYMPLQKCDPHPHPDEFILQTTPMGSLHHMHNLNRICN